MNATSAMDHEQAVDAMRADFYRLLGALMLAPPSAELLQHLGATTTEPDADDALNLAWCDLVAASADASSDMEGVVAEYDALFIGVGRGEVVPYASWYITGMLMDKPLLAVREDLEAFGLQREKESKEPEDHAGALCELMAHLVSDGGLDYASQKSIYVRHLASWMRRFFGDLQQASSARFYRAVGAWAVAFMAVESDYFLLDG